MKDKRVYFPYIFIFCISVLLTFDLFFKKSVAATFDGLFHFTVIAQFANALFSGDFPVRYAGGFANYGSAIPILAHQITSYLGALLYFLTDSVVLSSNILYFIGAFLSGIFLYRFLKLHVKSDAAALTGVFLFTFTSYRILNIYIRGALPEFFSGIFVPIILIGLYELLSQKKILKGFVYVGVGTAALALNHPMMFLIYSILLGTYSLYLLLTEKPTRGRVVLALLAALTGVGIAGYYIIPLLVEVRYFYYGIGEWFAYDHFLKIGSYVSEKWQYTNATDVFQRVHIVQPGIVESVILSVGAITLIILFFQKKLRQNSLLVWAMLTVCIYMFFTLPLSTPFYKTFSLLRSVQFGWRMLGGLIFLPPIIVAFLLDRYHRNYVIVLLILVIAVLRFPQLYGKNYVHTNEKIYFFNNYNAHSVLMQTVWSGSSESYKIQKNKWEIIEGKGKVVGGKVENSKRTYYIQADTPVRMADYTFYFPGWHAYVDNSPVAIEFQDVHYRGIITYRVPKGKHTIKLVFENTKIRLLSNVLSLLSLGVFVGFCFVLRGKSVRPKVQKAEQKNKTRRIPQKNNRRTRPR